MPERDEKYVACPYSLGVNTVYQAEAYRNERGGIIRCEGVSKSNVITLIFDSKEALNAYKKAFCYEVHRCRKCLIHQMLNRKYGVDDDI